MDDLSGVPSDNPFDQINSEDPTPISSSSDVSAALTGAQPPSAAPVNPFDAIGPGTADASGIWGSFTRALERGVAPAIGSFPAIGAGAEIGGELGGSLGSIVPGPGNVVGGAIGGIVGGVAGGLGAGTALSAAQDWAIKQLPSSWQEALGQDDRQQKLDNEQHPVASFLGGLAPYALTMRPGGFARGTVPENSTALRRILANPVTARVFGGAAMGGMELGNEKAEGGDVDWRKVAISTGFGLVFNRPTTLGESLTELGAGPVRSLRIPEAAPTSGPLAENVPKSEAASPTVAQAGDTKVMGPGITEDVFQGVHDQDPAAAMTAQDTARTEQSIIGTLPEVDLHSLARRIDPDTFEKYDALSQQRDSFRQWIADYNSPPPEDFAALETKQQELQAQLDTHVESQNGYSGGPEARRLRAQLRDAQSQYKALQDREQAFTEGRGVDTPEVAAVRQHLQNVDYQMRDLAPDVSAAYRRASDYAGQGIEPEAPVVAAPEPASVAPEAVPSQAATPTSPTSIEMPGTPAPPARPIEDQLAFIANDVAQKLVKAGRPVDEAEASGKLLAARYQARADRFSGALGTPEDLYRAEGADIRKGKGGVAITAAADQPLELAQAHNPQTDTPEFKSWFGESKVTDDASQPRVVYHGTVDDFEAFDPKKLGNATGAKSAEKGYFFSSDPEVASSYAKGHNAYEDVPFLRFINKMTGGLYEKANEAVAGAFGKSAIKSGENVIPAYLSIKNPLEFDFNGQEFREQSFSDLLDMAKAGGHDGAVFRNSVDPGFEGGESPSDIYVAFEPTQIKSAIGNNGRFDPSNPKILEQTARGKIRIAEGERPIITLMKDANASTFIHETGHQWLEELMQDDAHEAAPAGLKTDAATVRKWLGVDTAADIKTRQHEKFARGFEQYMREGVAPSPALAGVFSKFKNWLTAIYQTLKGLGKPINEDIRDVMDRLLSTDPQRTIYAPDREAAKSLQDIHAAEAEHTEPAEADATRDRVKAEKDQYLVDQPEPVVTELDTAVPADEHGGEAGSVEGGSGQVDEGSGQSEPLAAGGVGSEEHADLLKGGSETGGKGAGVSTGRGTAGGSERATESESVSERGQRPASGKAPGSELAATPSTLFGPDESPLLDKAGNIRLDTLTTNQDVAQAIRDAADANEDFIGDRRGVVTDGQVMDLADALGMDYDALLKRRVGQAFNAEQVIAARKLLIQSATGVSEAMKKAAIGTDEDVMAYAAAKDRHQMIQAQVAGITAEAGRALRAFRNIAGEENAVATNDFIKQATGKTLFQLRMEAKLGAKFDTPAKVSKYLQDAQKRSFGGMALEYFINDLISGPITHATYSVGLMISSLEKAIITTPAAAAIGAVRTALGREGQGVLFGESAARLMGAVRGLPQGIEAAIEAARTGATTMLPGETAHVQAAFSGDSGLVVGKEAANAEVHWHEVMSQAYGMMQGIRDGLLSAATLADADPAARLFGVNYSHGAQIPDLAIKGQTVLPLGNIMRLPSRSVATLHSFFRAVNYSMEKSALAYRTAVGEGLAGDRLNARVADIRQNPTEQLMEQAREGATNMTLMGQGGTFINKVSQLFNWEVNLPGLGTTRPLKFIDPFIKIAASISNEAIMARTPVGLLSGELRSDILGRNGAAAQDMAQAKMLVGSMVSMAIVGLAAEGKVSGSGPSDPHEAAMWRLAGNQPYSVKIGGTWYGYHSIGPLGFMMGIAADLQEVSHAVSTEQADQVAHLIVHAFAQNFLDEGFMRGPAELIQAVSDDKRYGQSYVKNFLSSFTPFSVGMAQVARSIDPYSRQARTVMDSIKAKIPGMSEGLYPRRDIWGEPMPSLHGLGGMTAIYETKVNNDPVNQAMLKLGVHPSPVERKIRGAQLTDQQYDDFSRISGRMTKMRLDAIVRSPDYQNWPDTVRRDVVNEVVGQSREAARGVMMMKNPSIVAAATKARLDKVNGVAR